MSNLNLKGVWIPIEILTDNKLSDKEKVCELCIYIFMLLWITFLSLNTYKI